MATLSDGAVLDRLDDEQVLALTMIGEARGDSREGGSSAEERIAVGCAVRTRVKTPNRFGRTYKSVCLKRRQGPDTPENDRGQHQFSCWDPSDPNRRVLLEIARVILDKKTPNDPIVDETLYFARGIISGVILDKVGGADHYYNPRAVAEPPAWAFEDPKKRDKLKEPTAIVGSHRFLKA